MHPTRREFLKDRDSGLALAAGSLLAGALHGQPSTSMPETSLCFTSADGLPVADQATGFGDQHPKLATS